MRALPLRDSGRQDVQKLICESLMTTRRNEDELVLLLYCNFQVYLFIKLVDGFKL
jgi:hypothetical protein